MKTLAARRGFSGSVTAKISAVPQTPPLVTKILVPLITYPSPSLTAVVSTPPASEPALASVRQKAPMDSPPARGGRKRSFCRAVPKRSMGKAPTLLWTVTQSPTPAHTREISSMVMA